MKNARPKAKPYKLGDEKGLYLLVTPNGSKLWRFDYRYGGKRKTLAFGNWDDIELAQARDRRDAARKELLETRRAVPNILHFHYREVVADPMAAIRKLYGHSGFDLSDIAEQRIEAFLQRPRPLTARRGNLAESGLDPGTLRERFARYVQHFAVP